MAESPGLGAKRGRRGDARLPGGWHTARMLHRRAVENEVGVAGVGTVTQIWEAIQSRRNVRLFADRPIPAADLDQILEAGRRSPSSQRWQPWTSSSSLIARS
jgi:hypothetical protein